MFVLLSILVLAISSKTNDAMDLLLFGGNGFIGAEVAEHLLQAGHKLTLVNRGNFGWDFKRRILPHVKHIKCDRSKPDSCQNLRSEIESNHYDAVVDFSAYKLKNVKPFYLMLLGHCDRYIYISTDSVYEVSEHKAGPSREEDSVRPVSATERDRLNQLDSYGNHKLEIEEFLKAEREKGGIPYVFLRLPDVLGPRDSTLRWWKYQLWIEFQRQLSTPIPIPKRIADLYTSYVYVKDVGKAVELVLKLNVQDEIFNIGFDEPKRLEDLLRAIAINVGVSESQMSELLNKKGEGGELPSGEFGFPSVFRGPIDCSKAKKQLQFEAADWSAAIRDTTEFYQRAIIGFPDERDEVVKDFLIDVSDKLSETNKHAFLTAIEQMCGISGSKREIKVEL